MMSRVSGGWVGRRGSYCYNIPQDQKEMQKNL